MIIFVCVFFFFFKQKTEYEMRISDWSSDVCSSDLPKGAMEGDGKHYQIYTATSGHNLDDYQRLVIAWRNGAPIRLGDVAEITDGPQDLRTLGQVGRASRRERVCQSVKIALGALRLKIKTQNTMQ